ncbi:MAG: A24 family peptidase [Nanoarchaeota archaeon]
MELLFIVAALILGVASLTDLRTREVPDWLSFAGIAAGLGIRLIESASSLTWSPLIAGVFGFGFAWVLATALFYLGQWGGGDSKMLMALGALFGLEWSVFSFSVSFLVNLLFVGGVYGLFWMVTLALRHIQKTRKAFEKLESQHNMVIAKVIAHLVSTILLVIAYLSRASIWWFPLVLAAVLSLGSYYLFLMLRSVEAVCFLKKMPVSELTEGDWIYKDVKIKRMYLCGPKDLGISKQQIMLLKKYKIKDVLVKSGIPFIPSFLIAFGVTLAFGNLVFLLL